jgi:cytochrome c biogenesis protein CcmG, thiol:disulfide interchange protein DsbE
VKRWAAIIALVPFSLILIVSLWLLMRPDPGPQTFSSPPRPVPERQLSTLDGGKLALPELKGRPYLVNFWASWCGPCKEEHPVLVEMAKQDVEIVGVLYGDPDTAPAQKILADQGNPFKQILLDPGREFGVDVGISGVPETFLVDANGMIVKTLRAPLVDAKQMQSFIDAYRAAKAPAG